MTYFDDIRSAAFIEDLPWNSLDGANILVTGATGLICSSLVEVLMEHNHGNYHVYASGRNQAKARSLFGRFYNDPCFHFLQFDVIQPLIIDIRFDVIIYGAGVASPNLYLTDPVSVMKSNYSGVDNLLSYGIRHQLKTFLYISSSEVYGEGDGRIFTEDYYGYVDSLKLRSCYPSVKRATESLCIAYGHQYEIDVRIARPCHIYGPYFNDYDNRAYAQFIGNVLEGKDIVLKSSGKQLRSWCYVVDCALALLYILLKGKKWSAYNIADDNSIITIRQFAEAIAEVSGKNLKFELPDNNEEGHPASHNMVLSTDKLKSLGWFAPGTLKNKLLHTIERRRCI